MSCFWIKSSAHRQLCLESNHKSPLETGGLLIGYCSKDKEDVVLTNIVGPGPKAEHGRDHYIPDYDYHRLEAARFYDESNGLLTYLGDWHSHPNGSFNLSWRDKRALKNICLKSQIYINNPCMLLLYGLVTDWHVAIWSIYKYKRPCLFNNYRYKKLPFIIFE